MLPHFLCLITALVTLSDTIRGQERPPNLIIFMADDVGHNDVGFLGSEESFTPNIDTLAADGVILENYYTSPLCTPSRGAFLSGVHPIHSGEQHMVIINGERRGFSLDIPLLPDYLKPLDYVSHFVGKWHLGFYKKIYTPLYRGYDTFYGFYGSLIDYFSHEAVNFGRNGFDFRDNEELVQNSGGIYATHYVTNRSIDLIRGHDVEKPLHLFVSYPNAHCANADDPYQAPEEYIQKFDHIENNVRRVVSANINTMDESIGLIVKALKEKDLLQNSIIVFVSDNGASDRGLQPSGGSNWPLRGGKSSLWEGGIRVPALIWSPLLDKWSYAFKGLMHSTDWLPTLLDAVGSSLYTNGTIIYGKSLWRSLSNNLQSPRDEILHNIDPVEDVAALRYRDFKLIWGHFHTQYNGWYGAPESYEGMASKIKFLRRDSDVFRTLLDLNRKPNYDILDETKLNCKRPVNESVCEPLLRSCLFNITEDPCEYNNLADAEPDAVYTLMTIVAEYARTAVEPKNKDSVEEYQRKVSFDPKSDPALHEGVWVSWGDLEHQEIVKKDVHFATFSNFAQIFTLDTVAVALSTFVATKLTLVYAM